MTPSQQKIYATKVYTTVSKALDELHKKRTKNNVAYKGACRLIEVTAVTNLLCEVLAPNFKDDHHVDLFLEDLKDIIARLRS